MIAEKIFQYIKTFDDGHTFTRGRILELLQGCERFSFYKLIVTTYAFNLVDVKAYYDFMRELDFPASQKQASKQSDKVT
jgi:hypothetical protein